MRLEKHQNYSPIPFSRSTMKFLLIAAMIMPWSLAMAKMPSNILANYSPKPKTSVKTAMTKNHGCPTGWKQFNRTSCYHLVQESNDVKWTWAEAQEVCKKEGGFLLWDTRLISQNAEIQESLMATSQQGQKAYSYRKKTAWVGLKYHNGQFLWSDDEDHTMETMVATAMKTWTAHQNPKGVKKFKDHCYLLEITSNRLMMTNCTRKIQRFVCQKEIQETYIEAKRSMSLQLAEKETAYCSSLDYMGWYHLGDSTSLCVNMYYKHEDQKNWQDARAFCRQKGGELASIHSQTENDDLLAVVSATIASIGDPEIKGGFDPYIGLKRSDVGPDAAEFVWSDGTFTDYDNWGPMEPSNYMGQESCVRMFDSYEYFQGTWNDFNCGVKAAFVCQVCIQDCESTVAPTSTPLPVGTCEEGWSASGPWCYKGFTINQDELSWFTYSTAETYCRDNGAWLASVHSNEENEVVRAAAANAITSRTLKVQSEAPKALIGLTDFIESDLEFYWDDQTPIAYTNWDSTEPNVSAEDQCGITYTADCVGINVENGKWSTEDCYLFGKTPLQGYVCRKPST